MVRRVGSVRKHRGRWTARFRYVDPVSGKVREYRKSADSKAAAQDLLDEMRRSVEEPGGGYASKQRRTFKDLAEYYLKNYAQPAQYVDGRKVFGLRADYTARHLVGRLLKYFAERRLVTLTYGDILQLKRDLLSKPTRTGGQRSVADVNRTLGTLRRLLNIAYREGWISRNPFTAGDSLISVASEKRRERILSKDEEIRLLAACENPRLRHLRPLIICALDTGMRRGEILKLRWMDIDLDAEIITIEALHTKTLTTRQVAITARLAEEIRQGMRHEHQPTDRVFRIKTEFKHGFHSAVDAAGILDLRFHDLRHTAATRLVQGHLPLAEVGRILGHADPKTTYRYVNADASTLWRGKAILEAHWTSDPPSAPEGEHSIN